MALPYELLSFDLLEVHFTLESVVLGLSDESAQGVWKVIQDRYTFVSVIALLKLCPFRKVKIRDSVNQRPLVGSVCKLS